jgi:hypothetical protein
MFKSFVILPDGRLDPNSAHLIPDDVELEPIEFPIVSRSEEIQAKYEQMRLEGQSHNIAEMLATRSFPGVKTDAIFNEGKFSGDSWMVGPEQQWLRNRAETAGVSTTGKWYCRGLADFPGDPTAWVDGRGDVMRIAAEKNMTVHGYVEQQGHEVDPGGDVPIADELISDEVQDILDAHPGASPEAVRDEVYQLRTGAVDTNALRVGDYDDSYLSGS